MDHRLIDGVVSKQCGPQKGCACVCVIVLFLFCWGGLPKERLSKGRFQQKARSMHQRQIQRHLLQPRQQLFNLLSPSCRRDDVEVVHQLLPGTATLAALEAISHLNRQECGCPLLGLFMLARLRRGSQKDPRSWKTALMLVDLPKRARPNLFCLGWPGLAWPFHQGAQLAATPTSSC